MLVPLAIKGLQVPDEGEVMTEENKKRCFVISPIGEAGSDVRRHADMVLNAIIRLALEDFDVKRADELSSPDMINDKVMDAIFNCEVAVADLTGHNPNVFYELGLRHMLEKPVIHIAASGTKLPFDNAGMTTIFYDVGDWHSHQSTKAAIAAAAQSCLSSIKVSNPVTQARGSIQLANSSDSRDTIISDLQHTVNRLEQKIDDPNLVKIVHPSLRQMPNGFIPVEDDTLGIYPQDLTYEPRKSTERKARR